MIKAPERTARKPLAYNMALENIKRQQQDLLRQSLWLRDHQKIVNAMYKRFDNAPEGLLSYDPSINVYGSPGSMRVSITASVRDIDGFKCPKLGALLALFIDADDTTTTDYATWMNRDYSFTFNIEGSNDQITVGISAYVKSDSATCRKVLKETKVVQTEQQIFEMICDDVETALEQTIEG
jgi:hypothetical protein